MTATRKHILLAPTWFGGFCGFIAFLIFGAVPGLVYGGYLGVSLASVVLGAPIVATTLAQGMTFGGMVAGLAASCFFFLVTGAFVGTSLALPFRGALRRAATAFERRHEMGRAAG